MKRTITIELTADDQDTLENSQEHILRIVTKQVNNGFTSGSLISQDGSAFNYTVKDN